MVLILIQHLAESPLLWICLLLGIFIYLMSLIIGNPRRGTVIFSMDFVRPPQPLVTDHAARNKVLKQRFKPTRVPENLDAVIIGSGIGALTTAVLLDREGKKVLVLEQHDQAGGCCHTFVEKGFEFDTGIHYVGKMGDGEDPRILIDQVTEGQVVWIPMDEAYDTENKWAFMRTMALKLVPESLTMFPRKKRHSWTYFSEIQQIKTD